MVLFYGVWLAEFVCCIEIKNLKTFDVLGSSLGTKEYSKEKNRKSVGGRVKEVYRKGHTYV